MQAVAAIFAVALLADSEMGEREVVFDRIVRIKPAQRSGNFARHTPVSRLSAGKTKIRADAADMGINRDYELRRRDLLPEAQIDTIGGASHPAQKHAEAFAGAAGGRGRKQKTKI